MGTQLKILGCVRVRNEARWIERCIRSMQSLCGEVLVMDDHSTDTTAHLALAAGAQVWPSPFADFNEARDKNWLYEKALELKPDWVLWLDGDETLSTFAVDLDRCARFARFSYVEPRITTQAGRDVQAYSFRIRYLWDREDQVRVDRWYSTFSRPSLFRADPALRFGSTYANGLHCGNTPGLRGPVIGDILHYGYMDRADRIRKYEYYNTIDPGNQFEDYYRHMVIGDVFPADSRFKWAGPLELRALL